MNVKFKSINDLTLGSQDSFGGKQRPAVVSTTRIYIPRDKSIAARNPGNETLLDASMTPRVPVDEVRFGVDTKRVRGFKSSVI